MHRLLALALLTASLQAQTTPRLQEPWSAAYAGDDVTGAHVLGHWSFEETKSMSLAGAKLSEQGKFGHALECFAGFPVEDKQHGALIANTPKLSPRGAFTLEMWLAAKPDFAPTQRCYLLDKKYVQHTDYQWQLSDATKEGLRRMTVNLGFGSHSEAWHSEPIALKAGEWRHVAFTYDGAGMGRFLVDGRAMGSAKREGCASIVSGSRALCIGDRLGSNYGGFPGFIDEVRLCEGVMNFERVALAIEPRRRVYRRLESEPTIPIIVTNLQRTLLTGAQLVVSGLSAEPQITELSKLAPGRAQTVSVRFNTSWRASDYHLSAKVVIDDYTTEQSTSLSLVPRPLPDTMPIVMWGASPSEWQRLRDIGFTHCAGVSVPSSETWKQGKPVLPSIEEIARVRSGLDLALQHGLGVFASLSPNDAPLKDPNFVRLGRDGKPPKREDIDASRPELAAYFENVGRVAAKAYGDHPALEAALINSEVRDHSSPSFTDHARAAYRTFAGTDIPEQVAGPWGVGYATQKDFPADRVVPDDHPILRYYRWFWTVGDGWNGLHSALAKGVKSSGRPLWTWFDPAVRQPSIAGAGGNVDVLSHWTYTYPDPQRIGLCTDQLLAMSAASGRGQHVMKMTQLIWYRSQTAPIKPGKAESPVAWEDHDPDAAYITIAPMHLKEALWTKLSRPVRGIMYHGWQSLVSTDSPGAYRFTNANTAPVLRQLIHDVVEPLGPTLLQLEDDRADIAFFESFTSQMLTPTGGYGNNLGWPADVWLAMQHAHLRCDVMFEETIAKGGLSGRRVLVMPDCAVLSRSIADKILAWQKKGGKIIADEKLCPAIKADLVLPSFKRERDAAKDKARVLELAGTLRDSVATLGLTRVIDCDNPEIIVRTRRSGTGKYVFAINDHRTAGDYVGQHGLVMEAALPSTGKLTLAQEGHVYDLTRSQQVLPQRVGTSLEWTVTLGPADGALYLITEHPLMDLSLEAPGLVKRGEQPTIVASLADTTKQPVKAAIPVQLTLLDANGVQTEGSGPYTMKSGELRVPLHIASNESPGMWEIRLRERATGQERRVFMRVE